MSLQIINEECSVSGCSTQCRVDDRLFCMNCRQEWREAMELNGYSVDTEQTTINHVLKIFQEKVI